MGNFLRDFGSRAAWFVHFSPSRLPAVAFVLLLPMSGGAHAATITGLTNLTIGSSVYDVTFHTEASTFYSLWNLNDPATTPTFWNDQAGAVEAANAIMAAIGPADSIMGAGDWFAIPYANHWSASWLVRSVIDYSALLYQDGASLVDLQKGNDYATDNWRPYASFELVTSVPLPAAFWLFGSGLGLLGWMRRKIT